MLGGGGQGAHSSAEMLAAALVDDGEFATVARATPFTSYFPLRNPQVSGSQKSETTRLFSGFTRPIL